MKVFIFEDLAQVSDRYHAGGGVVIIARDIDRAKALVEEVNELPRQEAWEQFNYNVPVIDIPDWSLACVYLLSESMDIEERVWIFPDAGCC